MKIKRIMFCFFLILVTFFITILTTNCYASTEDDKITTTLKVFNSPERNLKINKSIFDDYKYALVITGKTNKDPYIYCYVVFSDCEILFDPLNGSIYGTGLTYFKDFNFTSNKFIDISDFTLDDFSNNSKGTTSSPYAFVASGFLGANAQVVCHSNANIYGYDKNNR